MSVGSPPPRAPFQSIATARTQYLGARDDRDAAPGDPRTWCRLAAAQDRLALLVLPTTWPRRWPLPPDAMLSWPYLARQLRLPFLEDL